MSRLLGTELHEDLFRRLSGEDLDACAEKVILVSTLDEQGWPHPAILSYFEVVAKDRRNIRLATYKTSSTTANMRRSGKATLSIIDERVAYYIKGDVEELAGELRAIPHSAKLNLRVQQVLADYANEEIEPGAYIAQGVIYTNPNLAAERRKAERVINELLE